MATKTFTSRRGKNRLVISTICTHLVAFHEAGFEFRTEIKRQLESVWWNPATWGRYEWVKSNDARQPGIQEYEFIQGADIHRNPADFGGADIIQVGYTKSSCVYSWVGNTDPPNDLGNDARSVNDVVITFTYNGNTRTLRHSSG